MKHPLAVTRTEFNQYEAHGEAAISSYGYIIYMERNVDILIRGITNRRHHFGTFKIR